MIDVYFYSNADSEGENIMKEKSYNYLKKDIIHFDNVLKMLLDSQMKKEQEENNILIHNFILSIKKVIFSWNKTIVLWTDNTKTIVSCQPGEKFDKEKGLAMCIIKKIFGNVGSYNEIFSAFDFENEDKTEYTINPEKKKKYLKSTDTTWDKF